MCCQPVFFGSNQQAKGCVFRPSSHSDIHGEDPAVRWALRFSRTDRAESRNPVVSWPSICAHGFAFPMTRSPTVRPPNPLESLRKPVQLRYLPEIRSPTRDFVLHSCYFSHAAL